MRIFKFGWLPLAVLALFAAGSLPAIAGAPTTVDGLLQSTNPNREHCVNVGLALAAMSEAGLVAETMSLPSPNASSLTGAAVRRIVVDAPASVGACVEFEGVWGDGTVGGASLKLSVLGPATSAALSPAMATANLSERGRGPQRIQRKLEALAKLEKPGTYQLTALVELTASKGGANASGSSPAGETARDSMRVPFIVELRAASGRNPQPGPGPSPNEYGSIEGHVYGANGQAIEGAVILPSRPATLASPGGPVGSANGTRTDADGYYAIKLPVGKYLVRAVARDHAAQYYKGAAEAKDAELVPVEAGQRTEDIDFALALAAPPNPGPAPAPLTGVSGKVVDADGNPIVRAMVQAAPLATGAIAPPPNTRRPTTWTDENGEYLLELKPGAYAVGAIRANNNSAGGGGPMHWWDGKDALEDADPIMLVEGDLREDVNFGLD